MTGGGSSIPEVRRLLATLATGRRCAEAGTAYGDGAAAMASTATAVVTVEKEPDRAELARKRLAALGNVELVLGDWRTELPRRGAFGLVFLDGGGFKREPEEDGPVAVALLERGGILVVDDLTPGRAEPDPARAFLLEHPDLVAAEILTTLASAAIVAVRR